MSITITCPKCRATLRANKAPKPDKMIQCLKCEHRFTSGESTEANFAAITASAAALPDEQPSPAAVAARPGRELSFAAVPLFIIAAIALLVVLAFFAGMMARRPADKPSVVGNEPNTDLKTILADNNPDPKARPKLDAKDPKADPEPDAKPETKVDAKRQQFTNLMIEAGIAANLKKFDDAIAAYTQAQKLFPDDEPLKAKLAEAQTGSADAEKAKVETAKLAEETTALIFRGDKAASKEQYAAAIDFYKLALTKTPTSDEAAEKLVAAQESLQKIEAVRKKGEMFDQHILAGKAALKAGNTADAIREFNAAARVLPGDPLPAELLVEADKQLAELKNEGDRKKQYQNLLDQGAAFLRLNNLEDARDAYKQALKMFPNDPAALKGLENVFQGAKAKQGDIAALMLNAQNALRAGQLPLALQYLKDAEKIAPNDPNLQKAIKSAELIQVNNVAYYAAMNRGIASMNLHNWADAVIAFSDAMRLVPYDPWASALLFDAQRGLAAANRRRQEYDAFVNQAMQMLRAQRYSDAAKTFDAAISLVRPPAIPDAQLQSLSRYAHAMAAGANLMAARQFPQAAEQYQLALNAIPGDSQAFLNQQKARFQANQPR